jgi:hypothetical protein
MVLEAVAKLQFSTACHTREVFWKPLGTMFSCAVAKLIEFCNRLDRDAISGKTIVRSPWFTRFPWFVFTI